MDRRLDLGIIVYFPTNVDLKGGIRRKRPRHCSPQMFLSSIRIAYTFHSHCMLCNLTITKILTPTNYKNKQFYVDRDGDSHRSMGFVRLIATLLLFVLIMHQTYLPFNGAIVMPITPNPMSPIQLR